MKHARYHYCDRICSNLCLLSLPERFASVTGRLLAVRVNGLELTVAPFEEWEVIIRYFVILSEMGS